MRRGPERAVETLLQDMVSGKWGFAAITNTAKPAGTRIRRSPQNGVMGLARRCAHVLLMLQIYFTSGRPRILLLGKSKIELRKAPRWQMELGTSIAGEAVRALAWIGQPHARKAIQKLQKRLPHHEWQLLRLAIGSLPDWMAQALASQDGPAKGPIQAKALLTRPSQLRNEPEDSP